MKMEDWLVVEAEQLMDELAAKHNTVMGCDAREEGMFEVLLWLFSTGEKPEIE